MGSGRGAGRGGARGRIKGRGERLSEGGGGWTGRIETETTE